MCSGASTASGSPSTTRNARGSSYRANAARSSCPTARTSSPGLVTVGRRRGGACSSTRGNSPRSGQAAPTLRRARRCPTNPNPPQRTPARPQRADRLTRVSTFVSTGLAFAPNRLCLRATVASHTRNHNPRVGGSSPSSGTEKSPGNPGFFLFGPECRSCRGHVGGHVHRRESSEPDPDPRTGKPPADPGPTSRHDPA